MLYLAQFSLFFAAIALTGCQKGSPAGGAPQGHHGRYAGIGLYSADRLWAEMKLPDKPKDDAGATTAPSGTRCSNRDAPPRRN